MLVYLRDGRNKQLFLGCLTSKQHACVSQRSPKKSTLSWLLNVQATCLCMSETAEISKPQTRWPLYLPQNVVGWPLNVPVTCKCNSGTDPPLPPDNCTCCHTVIQAADQTFCPTRSRYPDTGPTSFSADPITPGPWQGSKWTANV